MSSLGPPISGETPIDDVSGLRVNGVTTRAELSVLEAANIEKVVAKYLAVRPSRRSAKFTYDWTLKLHKEMLGDVWRWAGKLRTRELNIGISSHAIADNLAILLDDLMHWPELGMDFTEQAARLHHRAVLIHPFQKGNGRWGRMLANIWLRLNRRPLTMWPEKVIGATSEIRTQYIAAIIQADAGDYEGLVAIHRQFEETPR